MSNEHVTKQGNDEVSVNDLLECLVDYGHLSIPKEQRAEFLTVVRRIQILLGIQTQE